MHIMETRFPCSPPFATVIIIVILFSLNFSVLSAGASAPWIEVHPPDIEERNSRIQFIRFIDADTGWAEAYGVLLRTSDGGSMNRTTTLSVLEFTSSHLVATKHLRDWCKAGKTA